MAPCERGAEVRRHRRIGSGDVRLNLYARDSVRAACACREGVDSDSAGELAEPLADDLRRFGAPRTVQPRLDQGTFRIAVTGAYGACAVSGERSLPTLEAAHVRPYTDAGEHALANGLLLRADIHRLYDSGYVIVTPDHRFRVSGDLVDDFHNGREYERFAGCEIAVPRARAEWPDRERLEWHGAEVFRG